MLLPGWDASAVLMSLFFFLAGVDSFSGKLPQPENLTLSWDPVDLNVLVHWRKPAGLGTECKVNYTLAIDYEKSSSSQKAFHMLKTESLSYKHPISKQDEVCVNITTNPMACNNKNASDEVHKCLAPPPALVQNFSCAYYEKYKMNCTWTPVNDASDLQLFYMEKKNSQIKKNKQKQIQRHCMLYLTVGNKKTGCHLDDKNLEPDKSVLFLISETGKKHLLNNRFMIDISESAVNPSKPRVYITQKGGCLIFYASTPGFLSPRCWKYKYTFSKCNEKPTTIETLENSTICVQYDPACKYSVQGQVIYSYNCGGLKDTWSDMSETVYFGEDGDPNLSFKVVMIITPLIVCCCLIAAIVLFRRNKDIILPKIPEPSLFFKDMLNSTSDGLSKSLGGGNLYVPVKEVVASGVSLEPTSPLFHPNHDSCI